MTDLPSRLSTQASTLFSNNVTKYILDMTGGEKGHFAVDLNNDVTRGSIIFQDGAKLWPPPPSNRPPPPPPAPKKSHGKAPPAPVDPYKSVRFKGCKGRGGGAGGGGGGGGRGVRVDRW